MPFSKLGGIESGHVAIRIHESGAVGCLGEFEVVVFTFRIQAVKQLLKLQLEGFYVLLRGLQFFLLDCNYIDF